MTSIERGAEIVTALKVLGWSTADDIMGPGGEGCSIVIGEHEFVASNDGDAVQCGVYTHGTYDYVGFVSTDGLTADQINADVLTGKFTQDGPACGPPREVPAQHRRCWLAPKWSKSSEEYIVRCYLLSPRGELIRHEDGDYTADDRQDAINTFNAMMDEESARFAK